MFWLFSGEESLKCQLYPLDPAKCEGVAGYLRNFKSSPGNSAQPSLEIIFVGLPGLKYPRAIGCESKKIGDIRVDCPQSYTCYESRPFPPGVMSGRVLLFLDEDCRGWLE